jgi:hypothetical protein
MLSKQTSRIYGLIDNINIITLTSYIHYIYILGAWYGRMVPRGYTLLWYGYGGIKIPLDKNIKLFFIKVLVSKLQSTQYLVGIQYIYIGIPIEIYYDNDSGNTHRTHRNSKS